MGRQEWREGGGKKERKKGGMEEGQMNSATVLLSARENIKRGDENFSAEVHKPHSPRIYAAMKQLLHYV